MRNNIRNIAIIAHVDHGKTTLVDKMLRQAGTFAAHQHVTERVMDSNDLEKERGITILAKNCAVQYQDTHINIVDTPGHADFGGEVERVLSMVDSVLLLVDAVDGPMPQTRFVTRKALALGLKPIVVVNKVDRSGARPDWVVNQTFDLFDKLGATEEQLDFPVIYASALLGWATLNSGEQGEDLRPLFDAILSNVPIREFDPEGLLQLQICSIDYSSFVGRIGVGRVTRGSIRSGQQVAVMSGSDSEPRLAKVNQVQVFSGLERTVVEQAEAGEIVLINGIDEVGIGVTICDPAEPEGLPLLTVDEPTLTMSFVVNTSPLAGREGKFVTMDNAVLDRIKEEKLVVMRYTDPENNQITMEYPQNPNGSPDGIAGICDPTGRLLGLMPHPEAFLHRTNHPRWTREDLPEEGQGVVLFRNAVDFIRENLL